MNPDLEVPEVPEAWLAGKGVEVEGSRETAGWPRIASLAYHGSGPLSRQMITY